MNPGQGSWALQMRLRCYWVQDISHRLHGVHGGGPTILWLDGSTTGHPFRLLSKTLVSSRVCGGAQRKGLSLACSHPSSGLISAVLSVQIFVCCV